LELVGGFHHDTVARQDYAVEIQHVVDVVGDGYRGAVAPVVPDAHAHVGAAHAQGLLFGLVDDVAGA
jgi:hypothetical protein